MCICTRARHVVKNQQNALLTEMKKVRRAYSKELDGHARLRESAARLDINSLRRHFVEYAGPDKRMSSREFNAFATDMKIDEELADRIWEVAGTRRFSFSEKTIRIQDLSTALSLQMQRRTCIKQLDWHRYCQTCAFAGTCDFCMTRQDECPTGMCNPRSFCVDCFANHPGQLSKQSADRIDTVAEREGTLTLARQRAAEAHARYDSLVANQSESTPDKSCPDQWREHMRYQRTLKEAENTMNRAADTLTLAEEALVQLKEKGC